MVYVDHSFRLGGDKLKYKLIAFRKGCLVIWVNEILIGFMYLQIDMRELVDILQEKSPSILQNLSQPSPLSKLPSSQSSMVV